MRRRNRFQEDANEGETMELVEALDVLSVKLDELAPADQKSFLPVSRYANQHATEEGARTVAEGGYTLVPRPGEGEYVTKGFGIERKGGALAMGLKALAEGTGSAGGFLVPAEYIGEITSMLRARTAVLKMGPTFVPVEKLAKIVGISTGATAYYTAENAAIPPSEQTFSEADFLAPKELTAMVPVSLRLLRDAGEEADRVIMRDLTEVMSLRGDLAFLRGSGSGGEPRGIRNISGINVVTLGSGNGAAPSYDALMDVVATNRNAGALFEKPGWIFHPRLLNSLEKLKDSSGRYLKEVGLLTFDPTGGGGSLLGARFATTTQIPTNLTVGTSNDCSEIYYSSDWDELYVGTEQDLTFDTSREASYTTDGGTTWVSAYQHRQQLYRAMWTHDVALRRPGLFTVVIGVRP